MTKLFYNEYFNAPLALLIAKAQNIEDLNFKFAILLLISRCCRDYTTELTKRGRMLRNVLDEGDYETYKWLLGAEFVLNYEQLMAIFAKFSHKANPYQVATLIACLCIASPKEINKESTRDTLYRSLPNRMADRVEMHLRTMAVMNKELFAYIKNYTGQAWKRRGALTPSELNLMREKAWPVCNDLDLSWIKEEIISTSCMGKELSLLSLAPSDIDLKASFYGKLLFILHFCREELFTTKSSLLDICTLIKADNVQIDSMTSTLRECNIKCPYAPFKDKMLNDVIFTLKNLSQIRQRLEAKINKKKERQLRQAEQQAEKRRRKVQKLLKYSIFDDPVIKKRPQGTNDSRSFFGMGSGGSMHLDATFYKRKALEAYSVGNVFLDPSNDDAVKKKSEYIAYLYQKQDRTYMVKNLYESMVSSTGIILEPAHLFTIQRKNDMLIVLENESISRATICFVLTKKYHYAALTAIQTYFTSRLEINKRTTIQETNMLKLFNAKRMFRITHKDLVSWQRALMYR